MYFEFVDGLTADQLIAIQNGDVDCSERIPVGDGVYSQRMRVGDNIVAYMKGSNGTHEPMEDVDDMIPEMKEYATNLLADMVVN